MGLNQKAFLDHLQLEADRGRFCQVKCMKVDENTIFTNLWISQILISLISYFVYSQGLSILHPQLNQEENMGMTINQCHSNYDKGKLFSTLSSNYFINVLHNNAKFYNFIINGGKTVKSCIDTIFIFRVIQFIHGERNLWPTWQHRKNFKGESWLWEL